MIDFNEISAISKTWNYRKTEDRNGAEDSFTVPEYSEKLKLKKIGGKSVVWNQLVNEGAVLTVTGRKYLSKSADVFSVINGGQSVSVDKLIDLTKLFGAGNEPTTTTDPRITAIKKYLETHPEYNEGEIIDSLVDEIEVDGVNLFDKNTANTINGYLNGTVITNDSARKIIYLPCESNTTYHLRKLAVFDNERFVGGCIDSLPTVGMNIYNRVTIPSRTEIGNELTINVTTGSSAKYIVAWVSWGDSWDQVKESLQISKGTTDYEYKPYTAPKIITTNFPSLKSAGSVYDYIDFTSAVKLDDGNYTVNLVRNVGSVDLGNYNWRKFQRDSNPFMYASVLFPDTKITGDPETTNILTEVDDLVRYTTLNNPLTRLNFKDGVILPDSVDGIFYYELATPTTETITISAELLEWLKVEYGGNMYYNQNGLSLPIPNTTSIHKHVEKTEELAQIVIDDEVVWSSPLFMFNLYDDIIIDDDIIINEETSVNEDEVIDNE